MILYSRITREMVENVLGEVVYARCHDFFKELLESSCCYKIIMTRRCFSLYKIFSVILDREGCHNREGTRIITNKALPLHAADLAEKLREENRVLIADDIIIYGRTINALLDAIRSSLNEGEWTSIRDKIKVRCVVKNEEHSRIDENYKDLVTGCIPSYGYDWRTWSARMSSLVSYAGIANTSYVVSAFYRTDLVLRTNSLKFAEFSGDVPVSIQLASPAKQCNGIEKYINGAFVRLRRYDDVCAIIPLVILREIPMGEMDSLCRIVLAWLQLAEESSIVRILSSSVGELQQMRMQLVTLILSHAVLQKFCAASDLEYSLKETDYIETLRYNFSEKILAEFEQIDDLVGSLLNMEFEDATSADEGCDLDAQVLEVSIEDTVSCIEGFSKERKDRFSIKDRCDRQNLCFLSHLIDSGRAAIRARYTPEDGFRSLMFSGEQAFMIGAEMFSAALEGVRYAEFLYGIPSLRKKGGDYKLSFHERILDLLVDNNVITGDMRTRCFNVLSKLDSAGLSIDYLFYERPPESELNGEVGNLIEKEVKDIVTSE